MATASKSTQVAYTLTLSTEEATVLRKVMGNVGGDPLMSPRGCCDSIATALDIAGLDYNPRSLRAHAHGTVQFSNYEENNK